MSGPLSGISVVELAGIGPAPHAGMMLSDMGADVVRIDRLEALDRSVDLRSPPVDVYLRGRRSIAIDLKSEAGRSVLLRLVQGADIRIESFRPDVLERLNLPPERLLEVNPGLVVGRVTGWGQDGPYASIAGHDINYIALAGALHGIGRPDSPPPPPLNYIGDFGGGSMLLLFGVLCALIEAKPSGHCQIVDAAMVDGAAVLGAGLYGQLAKDVWSTTRGPNNLDGSAPDYDSYRCRDGSYITIAPLEPQFHAEMCRLLDLHGSLWEDQHDRSRWAERKQTLANIFAGRDQQEWCGLLEGTDACFAPVLSLREATMHPHNLARKTFVTQNDVVQPAPAPRLSRTAGEIRRPPPHVGEHTVGSSRNTGSAKPRHRHWWWSARSHRRTHLHSIPAAWLDDERPPVKCQIRLIGAHWTSPDGQSG